MPINLFGNNLHNSENKVDTSAFVRNKFLRNNYIESSIEEDIDIKNQFEIQNLEDSINNRYAASKNHVDDKIYRSIKKKKHRTCTFQ